MTDLVPTEDIENIVGVPRHATIHYGRAVSSEGLLYILHSQECLDYCDDLNFCGFSLILDDRGINLRAWSGFMDTPVGIYLDDGDIFPYVLD